MESLFAFAVYVEHIYGIHNSCKLPAVGFRFLDYPTVVINSDSQNHSSDDLKPGDNATSNDDSSDDNINSIFNFGKGKSCLFKNSFCELNKILKEIPLYVMVFDSSDEKSRLIGCCSIPLIRLFNKLKYQIDDQGLDSPVCSDQIGRFVMYNLMGVKTGELKLQLKLNFYGASLLKHRSPSNKVSSIDTYLQLKSNVSLNEEGTQGEKVVVPSDERPLEIKQKKVDVVDKGIQCIKEKNEKRRKKKKEEGLHSNLGTFDDFHDANVYCPPPLFLNLYESHSQNYEKKQSDCPVLPNRNFSHLKDALKDRYGSAESIVSLEEPYVETLQPLDNKNCVCIISDNQRKCSPAEDQLMKRNQSAVVNHHLHLSPQSDCPQHLNNVDISKLPLLSALSAEIAKLTYFISKKEGELDTHSDAAKTENEPIQIVNNKYVENDASISPNQTVTSSHSKAHAGVSRKDGYKFLKANGVEQLKTVPKGKLKFKTTRTQKLRSKYVKQSKLVTKEKIPQVPEIKWDDECTKTYENGLNINSVDEVGEWMKRLQVEGSPESHVGMSPRDIHISDLTTRKPDEPSSGIVEESSYAPTATNPGFYSPTDVNKIHQPEHVETNQISRSKKKYRTGSRGIESSHSVQSRGVHSRLESRFGSRLESHGTGSRNELSMYANDTFASEDGPGQFSDSQSTLSETSSISLPFSGRDSETSVQQVSNVSGRSQSQSSPFKNDSNASHKSRKSLRHQKNSNDSIKSLPQQSRTSDKSNKSLCRQANVSEGSDNSLQEHFCASTKSEQQYSQHTNESGNSKQEDKPLFQTINLSDKPALHSQDSNYFEKQRQQQLNASDSVERLNSSHLSSVGLERYMAADNSTDISDKHSLDILDNSRPETQASVNTIPEDNVLSPKHVSYASPHKGDYDPDASFSPFNSIDKSHENMENTPTTPFSPDDMGDVKPNSSMYSPRKSKHNTTSFQVTKRAHGMGKLDERPESQLSSDTTLKEIDKLLGEDSQLTSGSSILMTTDDTVSPIGSMNIPQKYKPLNQTTHGFNKFDKRQVDTVEEVEDNFGDVEYLPSGSMDTTPSGTMGTLPTGTFDGLASGSMMDTLPTGPMMGTMDTLHEYETYEKPKKSDFSPHQSKQFVQRKNYENAIRENLPPFSSNTNESSLDSGF